ncbi:uncharacterized protein LOC124205651 isoform X1 [Daphnia pulex]|uniref:uncharacterized protein LOC124205651 isoform X1 n=1 Tax=Daphnia pulex TaxID=6669 RepID=UPI001EDF061B|nr:uncharacterized protein LOC124205651 isoform X1 [Daphnia pulex]
MALADDCYNKFRFHHLTPYLVTIVSLLLILILHQFVVINEFQIIHFKHLQGEKKLLVVSAANEFPSAGQFNSLCSLDADRRGPHQKVISYSIYGNFSQTNVSNKYLKPFGNTINAIPVIYPGWIVRIYHNLTTDDVESWEILKKSLDLGGRHVDLCNATEIIQQQNLGDIFAMTWRWLPLLDDMVDTLMSRDSDSHIIPREQEAVNEWLASDRIFHIMRDHPWHCRFIVGCCWGVKVSQDRSTIVGAARKMFTENHLHEYDYDQKLLDRLIWPIATTNMMAHDSYCCEKIPSSRPFPTQRKDGFFIGWRAVPKEELQFPCPQRCRPANVTSPSDWNFC